MSTINLLYIIDIDEHSMKNTIGHYNNYNYLMPLGLWIKYNFTTQLPQGVYSPDFK